MYFETQFLLRVYFDVIIINCGWDFEVASPTYTSRLFKDSDEEEKRHLKVSAC